MSHPDARPALSPWLTLPGLAAQGCGIFVLPFLVGLGAALIFEMSEVIDTLPTMLGFTAFLLLPIVFAQIVGLLLKARHEILYWRGHGDHSLRRLLDVLYRHLRVVTMRGWTLLFSGTLFTLLALGLKWASFGLVAMMGLFLFYLVTGWTVFVSTFMVRTFSVGLGRTDTGITRELTPAVCLAGDAVQETFRFRRVPVPMGYHLLVEDPLPPRLRTESRYVVGAGARTTEIACSGRLRATPRGLYTLGPARLWYQDVLGISRVSLASVATAQLKVLPRFRRVEVIEPPKSPSDVPDIITRPHLYATEDHFRFREYAPGDDTRRIHWRLSLKTGRLQVRQPESREINTQDVVLLLDDYLPPGVLLDAAHGADDILDGLVDAWLGIARTLIDKGDRVTLVAALRSHDGQTTRIEKVSCRKGESMRWQDMGARASWQGQHALSDLLDACGEGTHGVIVTARFTSPPPGVIPGKDTTWLFLDPAAALGPVDPHWLEQVIGGRSPGSVVRWLSLLPHASGSEDNAVLRRLAEVSRTRKLWQARAQLRRQARTEGARVLDQLKARGDAVFLIEAFQTHIRLRGVQGHQPAQAKAAK